MVPGMVDLHITNGDSAANLIRASTVEGDVLPWRDPMHHGPFPSGADLDELARIRGRYLSGPESDGEEAIRDFVLRDEHLRASDNYDRVVLWFEHDLLDQLQLLQLLDWYATSDLTPGKLELICINEFEGFEPFRGLGELSKDQIATLTELCVPVSQAQVNLARVGWAAFRSDDPIQLHAFASSDLSALPFLQDALVRHLQEFPWSDNGLTRTEHQLLRLCAEGIEGPGPLFVANMELETALYMGDWPTYRNIGRLCSASDPLIELASGEPFIYPPFTRPDVDKFKQQSLRVTDYGMQVLDGKVDAFESMHRDIWLGGVHVVSGPGMWTWHAQTSAPLRHD